MTSLRGMRVSLAQFLLLVALAAISVSAGLLLRQPSGTPEYLASAVAFSPDGNTLAASLYVYHEVQSGIRVMGADASQSFFLLNVPDLRKERLLERTARAGVLNVAWPVRKMGLGQSLAFSPDGTLLATQGMDNSVSIWNVDSGQKLHHLSTNDQLTGGVCWATNGTLAVSAGNACYILPTNAGALQKITGPLFSVAIAISGDGSKLATADDGFGRIELWDVRSAVRLYDFGREVFPFDRPGLAISADGQLVAAGSSRDVRVWDTAAGNERFSWHHSKIFAVAFSPDATTLAAGGYSKLHLLSLKTDEDKVIDVDSDIATVAFSPDGKLLATGDSAGQVCLRDARTMKLMNQATLQPASGFPSWPALLAAGVIWVALWIRVSRQKSCSAAA